MVSEVGGRWIWGGVQSDTPTSSPDLASAPGEMAISRLKPHALEAATLCCNLMRWQVCTLSEMTGVAREVCRDVLVLAFCRVKSSAAALCAQPAAPMHPGV